MSNYICLHARSLESETKKRYIYLVVFYLEIGRLLDHAGLRYLLVEVRVLARQTTGAPMEVLGGEQHVRHSAVMDRVGAHQVTAGTGTIAEVGARQMRPVALAVLPERLDAFRLLLVRFRFFTLGGH